MLYDRHAVHPPTSALSLFTLGRSMSPRLRGPLVLAYAAVSMAFFFVVSIPVMLLTLSGDFPMWLCRRMWATSALWVAGVKLDVHWLAPLPAGPLIFVSNHESALDIWAVVATIPRGVRFVAKRELFQIPIFGWYLAIGGHVEVDRKNRSRAIASLTRAAQKVRDGTSLIVFPEGTRSHDGRVHPFKKGPFVIASQAGVPLIPIAVSGAGAITPKNRIEVHPGTLHVSIGPAVDSREYPNRDDLMREVRRRIIEQHLRLGGLGGDVEDAIAARGLEGVGTLPESPGDTG
jgi:1-acyl-sn-glycerol-3-phosphate acyltransferase